MIRDELMQRVVNREDEPITPFIDRIRELYEQYGISTILRGGKFRLLFSCGGLHCPDEPLQTAGDHRFCEGGSGHDSRCRR